MTDISSCARSNPARPLLGLLLRRLRELSRANLGVHGAEPTTARRRLRAEREA